MKPDDRPETGERRRSPSDHWRYQRPDRSTERGGDQNVPERGEGEPVTPQGNTTLQPGDLLTVYSVEGATPDVTDIFGLYEQQE